MLAKKPKGATEKRSSSGAAGLLWMFIGAILTLMIGFFLYLWNPIDMGTAVATEEHTVQPINKGNTKTADGKYEFYELLPEQEVASIPDEAVVEVETTPNVTLKPDVVITKEPEANDAKTDTETYGISEETMRDPLNLKGVNAVEGDAEMVVVEEEGTYDEPSAEDSTEHSSDSAGLEANVANGSQAKPDSSTEAVAAALPTQTYILQINSFSSAEEADKRRAQVLMTGVDAEVVRSKMANDQVFYQVVSRPMTSHQAVVTAQQKLQNNGIDSLVVEQHR